MLWDYLFNCFSDGIYLKPFEVGEIEFAETSLKKQT